MERISKGDGGHHGIAWLPQPERIFEWTEKIHEAEERRVSTYPTHSIMYADPYRCFLVAAIPKGINQSI
jgi:hypothetical protein